MLAALLELADDHLILGHRLSEWCGHAPTLEEDLALPNMALDILGAARGLYAHAANIQGLGHSEDDLAFLRTDRQYRNCLMVERPNGDFAHTILRQFFFAAAMEPYWQAAMQSGDPVITGIAGKSAKEMAYHIRHSGEWVVRLGDGTAESTKRMAAAVQALAPYTAELFAMSSAAQTACDQGILPDRAALTGPWQATVDAVFAQANLEHSTPPHSQTGGRRGIHGEEMGHLLSQLQYMQRTYPGAKW